MLGRQLGCSEVRHQAPGCPVAQVALSAALGHGPGATAPAAAPRPLASSGACSAPRPPVTGSPNKATSAVPSPLQANFLFFPFALKGKFHQVSGC